MRTPSQWVDRGPEYDQGLEHADDVCACQCALEERPRFCHFGHYGANDLVLQEEAATLLGVPAATLEGWARNGMGPRVRKAIAYKVEDLVAFLERRTQ